MAETSPEYLAGLIVGIKEHLDRQDRQHDTDKQAAIKAREEKEAREDYKHEQNQGAIETVRAEVRQLTVQTMDASRWITEFGKPCVDTVNGLMRAETVKKSRAAGAAAVWGMLGAGVTLILSTVGTLAAIGPDGIKALGEILGRHH